MCVVCMVALLRFCQLEEPAALRKQLLEESQRLQEFYRDVEGEFSWVKEKEPIASSDDLGKNLTGVQNLLKKHQVLIGEERPVVDQSCFFLSSH